MSLLLLLVSETGGVSPPPPPPAAVLDPGTRGRRPDRELAPITAALRRKSYDEIADEVVALMHPPPPKPRPKRKAVAKPAPVEGVPYQDDDEEEVWLLLLA